MDKLEQKLKNIQVLLKAEMPSIKKPKHPTPSKPPSAQKPTAPKANQALSSKDPTKVAEQIKDPAIDRDSALKEAKKLKEGVQFNHGGQWSIKKTDEELEKSIKKKLGALALAGSALMGGSGEAKGDVGHLKHYLKSLHGMELGDHTVKVSHKDTTSKDFRGSAAGGGKFRIMVGDFNIDGSYSGVGDEHSKITLSKPYHHKMGHTPFGSDNDTQFIDDKGDLEADNLHHYLSGASGEKELSLQHHLQMKRKPGDKRGLDIGSFNIKKADELDKVFAVPFSP